MMNLHFGCGTVVGASWYNCDSSLTLRLQRLPLAGFVFRLVLRPRFPKAVRYGDISKGLKLPADSCEAIFCSHVLEHLSLEDLRKALKNVYQYLKPGGRFRAVLPDLERHIRGYISNPDPVAALNFMKVSGLGQRSRPEGIIGRLRDSLGNSRHLWMWDFKALKVELEQAGFTNVKRVQFGDSPHPSFAEVENAERFQWNPLAFECTK